MVLATTPLLVMSVKMSASCRHCCVLRVPFTAEFPDKRGNLKAGVSMNNMYPVKDNRHVDSIGSVGAHLPLKTLVETGGREVLRKQL